MFLFIKNLLFPKICLCCNKFGKYICKICEKKLSYLEASICLYCEKKSEKGITHPLCQKDHGVDCFLSVFDYNAPLKRVIASIKYRLITDAFEELFTLLMLSNCVKDFKGQSSLLIQPIPLHKRRYNQRGFNQSTLLGNWIAQIAGAQVVDVLKRVKETKTQATLSKIERAENAKYAFAFQGRSSIAGKTVVIVDDVVTTGSTVKEATRVLKAAGAAKIVVFSIAKG